MGKKAPMWAPSKKELEKILEVDNVHELFLLRHKSQLINLQLQILKN